MQNENIVEGFFNACTVHIDKNWFITKIKIHFIYTERDSENIILRRLIKCLKCVLMIITFN